MNNTSLAGTYVYERKNLVPFISVTGLYFSYSEVLKHWQKLGGFEWSHLCSSAWKTQRLIAIVLGFFFFMVLPIAIIKGREVSLFFLIRLLRTAGPGQGRLLPLSIVPFSRIL